MRKRGLTLVELMVALIGMVFILAALATSYSTAAKWQARSATYAQELEAKSPLEDSLRELIQSAYLTPQEDTASYFLASSSQGVSENSDTLTFTRIANPPSSRALRDTSEFEDRNATLGILGGLEEVSLSPTPVGEEAQGEGIFLRRQRPADSESTQGGKESLLTDQMTEISYEFYTGEEWVKEWDTLNVGPRRLPAAVRITYRLQDETDQRILTIPLKHSDATPENPVTTEVTTGG